MQFEDTHLWFFISHGHSFGASLRFHTKNTGARTYPFPYKIFEPCVRGHAFVHVRNAGRWMATGNHEDESAVWAWAGESQCAWQGHMHAQSLVFPFGIIIIEIQLSHNIRLLAPLTSHQHSVILKCSEHFLRIHELSCMWTPSHKALCVFSSFSLFICIFRATYVVRTAHGYDKNT